jgi:hypothetical protein
MVFLTVLHCILDVKCKIVLQPETPSQKKGLRFLTIPEFFGPSPQSSILASSESIFWRIHFCQYFWYG